jgi:hypothetical protein
VIKRPPIDEVRDRFSYDAETGVLSWRKARSHLVGREAGSIAQTGYRMVSWMGRSWPAHRLIWTLVHGEPPNGEIDHINGNRADNRLLNLRDITPTENRRNCARSVRNSSGVLGVSWHRRIGKWHAQIKVGYRSQHLGYFESLESASVARKQAEMHHGFHPNHGRQTASEGAAAGSAPMAKEELR